MSPQHYPGRSQRLRLTTHSGCRPSVSGGRNPSQPVISIRSAWSYLRFVSNTSYVLQSHILWSFRSTQAGPRGVIWTEPRFWLSLYEVGNRSDGKKSSPSPTTSGIFRRSARIWIPIKDHQWIRFGEPCLCSLLECFH